MSTDNFNTASQMIKDMCSRESNEPPPVVGSNRQFENSPNVHNNMKLLQDQKKISIRRTKKDSSKSNLNIPHILQQKKDYQKEVDKVKQGLILNLENT